MNELLKAVQTDKPDEVKKLVASGVNIDIVDFSGFTPLLSAIYNQNVEMVRLLLELGANTEISHPITGNTYISQWANNFVEFEYWEDLEEIFFLYCEYAGWKRPEWSSEIVHLIFSKGWPKAADHFKQDF